MSYRPIGRLDGSVKIRLSDAFSTAMDVLHARSTFSLPPSAFSLLACSLSCAAAACVSPLVLHSSSSPPQQKKRNNMRSTTHHTRQRQDDTAALRQREKRKFQGNSKEAEMLLSDASACARSRARAHRFGTRNARLDGFARFLNNLLAISTSARANTGASGHTAWSIAA